MNLQTSNLVLQAHGVSKSFGKKSVLRRIQLDLPEGKIYGITGCNGAGKSVLLRVLCGLIHPDEGEIRIFGKKIGSDAEFAPNTGILIDSPGFLRKYSAYKNLSLLGRIRENVTRDRIIEVLKIVNLDPDDNRPVRTYSSGMLQRLYLAQALMEDPALLLLDEPTNMLDINGQREVYDYLVTLNQAGKTILITSNYPDELKILCDAVFTLKNGELVPYSLSETAAYSLAPDPA